MSLAPVMACAIVIRPGVPDARYLVPEDAFPALVDLPGEGEGTLIAPRWVVTAAHATQGPMFMEVRIHGKLRKVEHIYQYPDFRKEYASFTESAKYPTVENWPTLKTKLSSMHDIALIELVQPVQDVDPVPLYRKSDEQGKVAEIIGRGATGNGEVGEYPQSQHRGKLRRAYNRIDRAEGQWVNYRFDCGPDALPLEGVLGDGDSGGPVLIKSAGRWRLAGVSDWKHWPDGHDKFAAGVCGQEFSNSRISYYAAWIDKIIQHESRPTPAQAPRRLGRDASADR